MIYNTYSIEMCPTQQSNHGNPEPQSPVKPGTDSSDEERRQEELASPVSGYQVFLETKKKLAKAMEGPEKILVGDIDNKTELVRRLSGGSFGEVFLGKMLSTGAEVAVKIEPQNFRNQFLLHEGNVYRQLEGGPGIGRVHWFGLHGSDYAVMTMDLLGPTLYDLYASCGERLTLKTVLQLADQMVTILEHVHSNNFVHRDISPNNFMIGTGEQSNKLFLIDFGHTKKVSSSPVFMRTPRTRFHPRKPALVGTPRFVSSFGHLGYDAALRDDMESLGFVWLYLLKGRLPWQGLKTDSAEEKMAKIAEMKMKTPVEEICKDVPEEFSIYLDHVRSLNQYDRPDYVNIRRMFRDLADKHDIEYDGVYDWNTSRDDVIDTSSSAGDAPCDKSRGDNHVTSDEPSNFASEDPVSH